MPHLFGGWRRRRGTLHEGTHEPCGQKGTHVETAPAGSPNRCFKHTCAGWLEMVQGCQFGGCLESESQRQPTKIIHERNALDFATVNLSCVMDLGQRRVFQAFAGADCFSAQSLKKLMDHVNTFSRHPNLPQAIPRHSMGLPYMPISWGGWFGPM